MPEERDVRWLLASDMDGTVIPPDRSPEHLGAVKIFREEVASAALAVVYVTGRHLELALRGVREFGLPEPIALACDVGTTVYWRRDGWYQPDVEYRQLLASRPGVVPAAAVLDALEGVPGLVAQEPEKQSDFKVSFYLEDGFPHELRRTLRADLEPLGRIQAVRSHDPVSGQGLLDILPADIGKGTAVDHVVRRLGFPGGQVVFAGDSGNDRDAFLSGMRAVVVGNAPPELIADVRDMAVQRGFGDLIYFADAAYCAGVSEGLRHFGALPG